VLCMFDSNSHFAGKICILMLSIPGGLKCKYLTLHQNLRGSRLLATLKIVHNITKGSPVTWAILLAK
jgi:hypothetical protein